MKLCPIAHQWAERTFTGRGTVGGYRWCLNCFKEQTRLFDYKEEKYVWVDGRFCSTVDHYFIFAASAHAYNEKKLEIFQEHQTADLKFTWVEFPSTFEYMAKVRDPMLALAKDYADMDLIRDYRFARLFEIGHL